MEKEPISLDIKIKYRDDTVPRIEKIEEGDWIDLYAAETIYILKDTSKLVNLGVAMKLPEGYEAHLLPRSSTFKNWGCIQTNSCGIIDASYCGNSNYWMISLYCLNPNTPNDEIYVTSSDPIWVMFLSQTKAGRFIFRHFFKSEYKKRRYTVIKKGDKIAQFRVMKNMPEINFEEVSRLSNKNRGAFGSTGTR